MTLQNSPRTVAVVVPLSNRPELTADEQISLKHLQHFLGRYDKYLIAPKRLGIHMSGFEVKRFDDKYFGSALAHGRLQLSSDFYEAFRDYKYILMYHLDALVFSDQLLQWCDAGWDFIGAPWLKCQDSPWVDVPRVGNSGFCLMKIESVLKVCYSRKLAVDPEEYWKQFVAGNSRYVKSFNLPRKYLIRFQIFNNVKREMARWPYRVNADYFWSDRAVHYYPEFKISPFEIGLRFAFEVAPRLCFELNNYRLPFGCHAWSKYDRAFWEPYLLQ